MSKLNRAAIAVLLSQPLVVAAGAACAFSINEGSPMPGFSLADPDAALDHLADQYSTVWSQPSPDYSQQLILQGPAGKNTGAGEEQAPAIFRPRTGRQ